MSYGSISQEAHETLAIAMNSIGARSNSGEGGESDDRINDPAALQPHQADRVRPLRRDLRLPRARHRPADQARPQGAKPGEGGHLPGAKVPPWIAKVRHATPGVEHLPAAAPTSTPSGIWKQLINDAKMANPRARIHVKLVSEFGVGTIAAGVAKCHADVVPISGYDGGTGAAPLNAIKHAGTPWRSACPKPSRR